MRITDSRYDRDRLRLALAYRLIAFEARTRTIRVATQLSDDRIRKLYRDYFQGASAKHRASAGAASRRARWRFSAGRSSTSSRPACSAHCCARASCWSARRLPTGPASKSWPASATSTRRSPGSGCSRTSRFEHAWHLWQMLVASRRVRALDLPGLRLALVAGHARHPAGQLPGLPARPVPGLKCYAGGDAPRRRQEGRRDVTSRLQRVASSRAARTAFGYAAGAWVLIQVIATVSEPLGWPAYGLRLVIIGVTAGFVVAVPVAAWYDRRERVAAALVAAPEEVPTSASEPVLTETRRCPMARPWRYSPLQT